MLEGRGYQVTVADTITTIRNKAELQGFDSVVCDDSVSPLEQGALAQVVRLRYPWMQILHLQSTINNSENSSLSASDAEMAAQLSARVPEILLD